MNGNETLPWPALYIIKNFWKTVKFLVQRRISEIENTVVQDIWIPLPQDYIQSMYASIWGVIRAQGQITKY